MKTAKSKWKWQVFLIVAPFVFLLLFMCLSVSGGKGDDTIIYDSEVLPQEVERYRSIVKTFCEKYEIPEYENTLLAIMAVESGGKGGDVMQASESLGQPLNSLDVTASIEQGCKYFSELVKASKKLGCDDDTVIQSYNFGGGFTNFVAQKGKKYKFELAQEFAKEKSGNVKVDYSNPIASSNGNWRYQYGNMYYVKLVHKFMLSGTGQWIMPIQGATTVTSEWGTRNDPFTGTTTHHNGIDFSGVGGVTPIFAVDSGTVIYAKFNQGGFGNCVVIDHGYIQSLYGHMSSIKVKEGQQVTQGQQVGVMGSTGRSTGVHLHLQAEKDLFTNDVNPRDYLGK
ncbi:MULTISPECIES: lysozyme family protein [Listeria]|uniref:lysozyme family protein n=1 Tax=Listeria TaxID=1637 RepID=UPI000B58C85B|nr:MULTISPECIES: lysozyme family protein [Listeria]